MHCRSITVVMGVEGVCEQSSIEINEFKMNAKGKKNMQILAYSGIGSDFPVIIFLTKLYKILKPL